MKPNDLKKFRKQIDALDKKLVLTLAERFKVTKKVGEYKAKYNLPAKDPNREKEMSKARIKLAQKYQLDEKMVARVFGRIIEVVRKNHRKQKTK